jgi:hypothetical protein
MANVCHLDLVPVHSGRWHWPAWNKMAEPHFTFEQSKLILKWYWKRRMWMKCVLEKWIGTCVRVAWFHDKFGLIELCKKWTRNTLKTLQFNQQWNESVETVLQVLTQSPGSLYGNLLIRLVSVKPVLMPICKVRIWIGQRGVWSIHPNLWLNTTTFFPGGWFTCCYSTSNTEKSMPLLHVMSSAVRLVVDILNSCEFMAANEKMG